MSQLPTRDQIEDYHFGDFIDVTLAELTEHLLHFGLPPSLVNQVGEHGFANHTVPDKWNVVRNADDTYSAFYEDERGGHLPLTNHSLASMREVKESLAAYIYRQAIVDLSAAYRRKHFPGLVPLPGSGEAWPDGLVRY